MDFSPPFKKGRSFFVPAEKYGNLCVFGVFCRVGGWFVVSWFFTKELKTHLIGTFFASQDIRWVCPHESKGGPRPTSRIYHVEKRLQRLFNKTNWAYLENKLLLIYPKTSHSCLKNGTFLCFPGSELIWINVVFPGPDLMWSSSSFRWWNKA